MAEAINHGVGSATAVIGRNTGLGMLWGILAVGLGFALFGGGVVVAVGLLSEAGISWTAAGIAAAIGGVIGTVGGAATGARLGGMVGFAKGLFQASGEEAAFHREKQLMGIPEQNCTAKVQEAYVAGAQAERVGQADQAQIFAQREAARRQEAAEYSARAKV